MAKRKPEPPFGDSRSAEQRLSDARATVSQAEDDAAALRADLDVAEPAGHMSDKDRARRNTLIFRSSLRGVDVYDLAQIYELHPRTVSDIIADQRRESRRLSDRAPLEVAEELIEQIDAGISEIASIAAKETGSTRVTAVLGRINALVQKGKWLQSAGILPEKASEMRVIVSGESMASNIMAVLERRGILDEALTAELSAQMGRPLETTGQEVLPPPAQLSPGDGPGPGDFASSEPASAENEAPGEPN